MIFLSLGSNLGDKKANLEKALELLALAGVKIARISSFYETAPWGNPNQDDFVNIVVEVIFEGSATELLEIALATEQKMGRIRLEKWGPRRIDIDIIDFHRQQIQTDTLTLPHPYYKERDFVMIPLKELEPDWRDAV